MHAPVNTDLKDYRGGARGVSSGGKSEQVVRDDNLLCVITVYNMLTNLI